MRLPIYKATILETAGLDGGTTHPCIMSVEDENGHWLPEKFVVKIFKPSHRGAICQEVFANALAREFDLQVPKAALVKVDRPIIEQLKKHEKYANANIQPGVYFATEFLSDAKIIASIKQVPEQSLEQMELIFAFDVLIRNSDRRVGKPNFLLVEQKPVLIDHELSLKIVKPFTEHDPDTDWQMMTSGEQRDHIFLLPLRSKHQKTGVDFGWVVEYLRGLKPEILFPLAEQLIENEYDEADCVGEIVEYLRNAKANDAQFLNLLTKLLQ